MRNFEEILNVTELEKARKKCVNKIFLFAIAYIIWLLAITITRDIKLFVIGIIIILLLVKIVLWKDIRHYKTSYKKEIIAPLIRSYSPKIDYKMGIAETIYKEAGFEEFSKYYSSNLMLKKQENGEIMLASVLTTIRDRNILPRTVFEGIFAVIKSNRIKDSSDLVDKITKYMQKSTVKFEIIIKSSTVYIRFKTPAILDCDIFQSLQYSKFLEKIDITLTSVFNIIEMILQIINET